MYRLVDPIIDAEPGATWLTIGDGRYGNDSQTLIRYLLEQGYECTIYRKIHTSLVEPVHQLVVLKIPALQLLDEGVARERSVLV